MRIASQQLSGKIGGIGCALEHRHVREPLALHRIAKRRKLCRSDIGRIHAA